ncbi:hypothetical protein [Frondihabitans australicus]|uniref:Uncharacterized protein n=1 Tax=Frondihabitans australicus TaxID=386892 RepID=A0A495IFK2_9MICO|nr:hypothetical protein [Frondihabitans australicus]RKR73836.1 hypothetical protein C8E83_0933 [Frondihabitans australicus]
MTATLPEVAPPPRPEHIPDLDEARAQDPALVAHQRAWRRRVLLASAPVIVVVLLVALKLLSLPALALTSQATYAGRAYDTSVGAADGLSIANLFEPWVQHFDRGAGLARIGLLTDARTELESSLALVPKSDTGAACMVRTDLLLVVEEQGDSAVRDQQYDQAEAYYKHALSLYDGATQGCFRDPDTNATPKTKKPPQDARNRLLQKQKQAQQQQQGQNGQGQGQGSQGQQNGQGQGSQGQGSQGGGSGSGQNPQGQSGQGQGQGGQSQGQGSGSGGSGSGGSSGNDPLQQLQQQDGQAQQQQQQDQNRQRQFDQQQSGTSKPW